MVQLGGEESHPFFVSFNSVPVLSLILLHNGTLGLPQEVFRRVCGTERVSTKKKSPRPSLWGDTSRGRTFTSLRPLLPVVVSPHPGQDPPGTFPNVNLPNFLVIGENELPCTLQVLPRPYKTFHVVRPGKENGFWKNLNDEDLSPPGSLQGPTLDTLFCLNSQT